MTWADVFERFGLPLFLLVAVGYAAYRAIKFVGEHLFEHPSGYISQLVTSHISFLKAFDQSLSSTTKSLEEIAVLLRELREMRQEERAELRAIRGAQDKT